MQASVNALARIVLAMGAETVEAVENPKLASAPLDEYTWIITFDFDAFTQGWPQLPEGKWVTWPWVRACLLSSKLLPRPDPPIIEEESQDM